MEVFCCQTMSFINNENLILVHMLTSSKPKLCYIACIQLQEFDTPLVIMVSQDRL